MLCDFRIEVFYILHSYCWRRGGHFKATRTEASAKPLPMHSALENALLEWKAGSLYTAVGIRRQRPKVALSMFPSTPERAKELSLVESVEASICCNCCN